MGRLVCRKLRPVSVEEECLALEECGLLRLPHVQHSALAPTSPRREVGSARSNQSAGQSSLGFSLETLAEGQSGEMNKFFV